MSRETRIAMLRAMKADWEERESCCLCNGTGMEGENECVNCDGVGVVPSCSWEEGMPTESAELATLEEQQRCLSIWAESR